MIWRCILDAPRDGAANMALDQALFEGVQAGGRPVLRLYRWDPPCLSFGRNQTARGVYDVQHTARLGADIVRRPTGGLAVYHHRELTYSVAASVDHVGRPHAAYAAINRALAAGLGRLGVLPAIAGTRARARPLSSVHHPCFGEAAPGEVVAGGRKLVGSAMRIERRTILQHGSILLDGDQSEVVALQSERAGASEMPAAVSLREVLGRIPDWSELHDAVPAGFEDVLGVAFEIDRPTPSERARSDGLEALYRSETWTWRR